MINFTLLCDLKEIDKRVKLCSLSFQFITQINGFRVTNFPCIVQ